MDLNKSVNDSPQKQIKNNKEEHPLEYYRECLSELSPDIISARTGLPFDQDQKIFVMDFIGHPVAISYPEGDVFYLDSDDPIPAYAAILLLRVLVEGNFTPSTGEYLPYAKIGWGENYLKAFNGRCIGRFSHMFKDSRDFSRVANSMGAREAQEGDAAFDFEFINGVFMRLILWDADDEFPMNAQILFSDNTSVMFTSEDAAVMGDLLLNELRKAQKALG